MVAPCWKPSLGHSDPIHLKSTKYISIRTKVHRSWYPALIPTAGHQHWQAHGISEANQMDSIKPSFTRLSVCFNALFTRLSDCFSALTLLTGRQEDKKLSDQVLVLFSVLHMVSWSHCHPIIIYFINIEKCFTYFRCRLILVLQEKRPLNKCCYYQVVHSTK